MVEHTALSRRQSVAAAVAAVLVLGGLVVAAVAAAAVVAVAAAIEEGVQADVDEGASVARADAYGEVSAGSSQYMADFSVR